MLTIHKYTIDPQDSFTVFMPEGAKLLHVETQLDVPCLWALVDTDREKVHRRFWLRGTGHDCDGIDPATYVGTFMLHSGRLVFHLFDRGEQ